MTQLATILPDRPITDSRNRIADVTIGEQCELPFEYESTFRASPPAQWLERILDDLKCLAELQHGWDSNGADSPEEPMILAAVEIAVSLAAVEWTRPLVVTATRGGGVQFEWGSHDHAYLELECVDRNTAEYFFSDGRSGTEKEGTVRSGESLAEIVPLILQTVQFS
jgi:hypothetical protein